MNMRYFVTALTAGACLLAGVAMAPAEEDKQPKGKAGQRPGEVNTPPAKGERLPDRLRVGDVAPDFSLPDVSGKKAVTLSGFKGRRPVVLIFGSYT
jgi:hypothetical protein